MLLSLVFLFFNRVRSYLQSVTDLSTELPNELLYGRVGYLYAQLYVNKHLGAGTIEDSDIQAVSK